MIGRSALRALGLLNSLFAMAVFSAPRPANAQQAVERSARATVDSFFAFAARERWDSAATMLDLVRFEAFFKGVVRNVRSAIPPRPVTVEDLMAQDSTMPRVVAEWQIARMKSDGSNPFFYLSYEFSGVANQHDLFALTISTAAARWLEAQDGRTTMREAWRKQGCPLADLPDFPAPKRTVVAIAVTGDSIAYVVHTDDRFGQADPENLFFGERVMRLHRVDGRRRIEPRRTLLQAENVGFSVGFDCPKAKRP